jgi:hypothetical protein
MNFRWINVKQKREREEARSKEHAASPQEEHNAGCVLELMPPRTVHVQ